MDLKKTSTLIAICGLLFVFACKSEKKEEKPVIETQNKKKAVVLSPEQKQGKDLLRKCLNVHGGLQAWKSFEGLEYNLSDNGKQVYQITNLKDRRAYIKSKSYEVGFDGKVAWALPDAKEVSGKSAAFYYNLDFYFVGIPFVLADPGVSATFAGQHEIEGKKYNALKITFGSGVGFTPEDVYYMYLNPETHILEILTYSIAYFDRENAGINSAKVYSGWKEVQGILMPAKMENFEWKDGAMGKSKNHIRLFSDIKFLKEIPSMERFEVPENAVVERLPK